MQLPLKGLAALGEQTHLPRDQLIEASALESFKVAIGNKPAVSQTEETQERPVTVDRHLARQTLGNMRTKLSVVGGKQLGSVKAPSETLDLNHTISSSGDIPEL